jgi:hypothetical protein
VGCRPYLSIDSTTLNGRWNGHLPSVTDADGHNWMYPIAFEFLSPRQKRVGLGFSSNYARL